MYEVVSTGYYFLRAIIAHKLGNSSSDLALSGKCILGKRSFRPLDKDQKNRLIVIRAFVGVLGFISRGESKQVIFESDCLIFDSSEKAKNLRLTYLSEHKAASNFGFLSRENLHHFLKLSQKMALIVLLLILLPFLFTFSLLSSLPANWAFLQFQLIEGVSLLSVVKKNNIRQVRFFCPYENDANLLALMLMNNDIEVIKHPSPGPLVGHNRILLASSLAISNPYHLDEIEAYSETIRVSRSEAWKPEFWVNKPDPVRVIDRSKFQLAFYSHGSWIRRENARSTAVFSKHETEEALLKNIAAYLKDSGGVSFAIYPHPYEKRPEVLEKTMQYYSSFFRDVDYELILDQSTVEGFTSVDLALTPYSAILFERLFCGYKTLVYAENMIDFPLDSSSFSNIAPSNSNDLFKKIGIAIQQSHVEFFESNGISEYYQFGCDNSRRIPE